MLKERACLLPGPDLGRLRGMGWLVSHYGFCISRSAPAATKLIESVEAASGHE